MTIQIELNPEVMERLAAEAEAEGIALEEYAERLLREAIATHAEPHARRNRGGFREVAEGANLGIHPRELLRGPPLKMADTRYLIDRNILIRWGAAQ